MQIPATRRALAAHTALDCVELQESSLVKQWSEAVFGRWPRVKHKSVGAVTLVRFTAGAGCQICWRFVLAALIPTDVPSLCVEPR